MINQHQYYLVVARSGCLLTLASSNPPHLFWSSSVLLLPFGRLSSYLFTGSMSLQIPGILIRNFLVHFSAFDLNICPVHFCTTLLISIIFVALHLSFSRRSVILLSMPLLIHCHSYFLLNLLCGWLGLATICELDVSVCFFKNRYCFIFYDQYERPVSLPTIIYSSVLFFAR